MQYRAVLFIHLFILPVLNHLKAADLPNGLGIIGDCVLYCTIKIHVFVFFYFAQLYNLNVCKLHTVVVTVLTAVNYFLANKKCTCAYVRKCLCKR